MIGGPNGAWFHCLPPCEAYLPCGTGRHIVRWEEGELRLPSHPDPEAELVLAALGGGKARCIEVAQAWGRHAEDLSVLAVGPRGPADEIAVSWDDVDAAVRAAESSRLNSRQPRRLFYSAGPGSQRGPRPAVPPAVYQQALQEWERAARHRNDLLSLFALGYGFQVRLIGQVAAASCGSTEDAPGTRTNASASSPPVSDSATASVRPVDRSRWRTRSAVIRG